MSNSPLMLEGKVIDPLEERLRDMARLRELERENDRLRTENAKLRLDVEEAMRAGIRAVSNLRKTLTPLYSSLQVLFGEMEAVAGSETASEPRIGERQSKVWESWKQKLGGMSARFIQALLDHGEMNAAQLRVAMQCRQQTVYETASKMNKLGLINKNGGRYSLKEL